MAASALMYGLFLKSLVNKEVNFTSDTIKVMLCTSTYAPNQDTHQYKSSVTNEVVGTGYTAGGATLASKTVTYTAGTNTLMLDAADPSWATSTITARYAVYYDAATGVDATSPVISYVDFGADVVSTAGTFLITIDPAGIAAFVAA